MEGKKIGCGGVLTLLVIVIFVMNLGMQGADSDDFAVKYAQKHGYNYSTAHDYVVNYVWSDYQLLPYPHVEYYVRQTDGSKKVVGSYCMWTYSVK